MRRVLVTGAGGSAGSNFVNSLRQSANQYYIVGTDASRYHLELADVDSSYLLPRVDDPYYLELLDKLVKLEKIDVVHAQPDVEVAMLSLNRDRISAKTFLPVHETIALCQDKAAAADIMTMSGVPVPSFGHISSENNLRSVTEAILFSHSKAWVRAIRGAGSKASLPVSTPDQAVAWARYWVEMKGLSFSDFMVSQFLPGREYAFQSLWRDGELITSAARERVEYIFGNLTPSGQTSSPSVAKSVHYPELNETATRCIKAIDPKASGVFCVDLKEDEHGRPLVTEINAGRFFTTSNFFAAAGANMPDTYISLAYGVEDVGSPPRFDAVPADLYWVRMVDMGYKLVAEGEWKAKFV